MTKHLKSGRTKVSLKVKGTSRQVLGRIKITRITKGPLSKGGHSQLIAWSKSQPYPKPFAIRSMFKSPRSKVVMRGTRAPRMQRKVYQSSQWCQPLILCKHTQTSQRQITRTVTLSTRRMNSKALQRSRSQVFLCLASSLCTVGINLTQSAQTAMTSMDSCSTP